LKNLLVSKVIPNQKFVGIKIANIVNGLVYQNPDKAKFPVWIGRITGFTSELVFWGGVRTLTVTAAVPEPSTMLPFVSGLFGFLGLRKMFKK
jgi:hypothetical protein